MERASYQESVEAQVHAPRHVVTQQQDRSNMPPARHVVTRQQMHHQHQRQQQQQSNAPMDLSHLHAAEQDDREARFNYETEEEERKLDRSEYERVADGEGMSARQHAEVSALIRSSHDRIVRDRNNSSRKQPQK